MLCATSSIGAGARRSHCDSPTASAAHMGVVGTRRMRAAELRSNCRWPSAVRSPQHRGMRGAVTVGVTV